MLPQYQRRYGWTLSLWTQLLTDLRAISEFEHFLGRLLLVRRHDDSPDAPARVVYTVMDGQQRLTTLFVLVVAIRRRLAGHAASGSLRGRLGALLILPNGQASLEPTTFDRAAFDALLADVAPTNHVDSPLLSALAFFAAQLAALDIDAVRALASNCLERATFTVMLFEGRFEEAAFEAFATKARYARWLLQARVREGWAVEAPDLIRSLLLAAVPLAQRADAYQQLWLPLEEAVCRNAACELTDGVAAVNALQVFFERALAQNVWHVDSEAHEPEAAHCDEFYGRFSRAFLRRLGNAQEGNALEALRELADFAQKK